MLALNIPNSASHSEIYYDEFYYAYNGLMALSVRSTISFVREKFIDVTLLGISCCQIWDSISLFISCLC